jgi:hypothetical protein
LIVPGRHRTSRSLKMQPCLNITSINYLKQQITKYRKRTMKTSHLIAGAIAVSFYCCPSVNGMVLLTIPEEFWVCKPKEPSSGGTPPSTSSEASHALQNILAA